MLIQFSKKDLRLILICTAIAAVSLFIGVRYFYRAFPEASIEFKVTREQSLPIAETFKGKMGWDVPGSKHASLFTYDEEAKTFLEKEMGLEKANRLLGSQIRIWRWNHRWFRPLQKEEIRIEVTTSGEIVSFHHSIEEGKAGSSLSPEEARTQAEIFLTGELKKDLSLYEFVEASTETRPKRTDHTFTWQEKSFEFQDSHYRISVGVQGDEVGSYNEYLKIPEKWVRDYQKLRSLNNAAGTYDSALVLLLLVGMLAILIQKIRAKDIKWKTALGFGIIAFVLEFLSGLNTISIQLYYYETTQSYSSFLAQTLLGNVGLAFLQGMLIALFIAGAEPLYREYLKDKISLNQMFLWQGLRTKHFFNGVVLGLTLTFFFFAYQIVFYLIANRLGAWAPADVPYSEMLNTKIPWVFVLLGGFFPAVFEETVFRMFAIPFIQKFLKSLVAALVLAGFIWGFGHAAYPNQPWYIRGVEVGVAGLIMGIVMLKYGILPALVWHYTVDAVYTSFLLLRSENTYFIVSGVISAGIMLVPLLISLIWYVKNKGFLPEENMTNGSEGTSVDESTVSGDVQERGRVSGYLPISGKTLWAGIGVAAIGFFTFLVPIEKPGDWIDFRIQKSDAIGLAKNFLVEKNIPVEDFRTAASADQYFPEDAATYLYRRQGITGLNRMFGTELPGVYWEIRFFKPLQKEEWRVQVDPKARSVVSFRHLMAEDSAGADLPETQALVLGLDFLKMQGLDPADLALKENSSEKKKNRRDYLFIWEFREDAKLTKNVDELKFRIRVEMQGDRISLFRKELKIPEEYEREFQKRTIAKTILSSFRILAMVLLIVWGIWMIVVRTRSKQVQWRPAVWLGLLMAGLTVLTYLNTFENVWNRYQTSIDTGTFLGIMIIGGLIVAVGVFLMFTFLAALVTSFYPDSRNVFRYDAWQPYARDAVFSSLVAIALWFGYHRLEWIAANLFPGFAMLPGWGIPSGIATTLPAWNLLQGSFSYAISRAAMIGSIVYLIHSELKHPLWKGSVLLLFSLALAGGTIHSIYEFLYSFLFALGFVTGSTLLVKYFLRNNPLAYLSAFLTIRLLESAMDHLSQGNPEFRTTGWVIGVVLLLWLGVLIMRAIPPMRSRS